jgi:hypothetical protein
MSAGFLNVDNLNILKIDNNNNNNNNNNKVNKKLWADVNFTIGANLKTRPHYYVDPPLVVLII